MPRKVKIDRSGERWIREEKLRQAEVVFITDRQRRPAEYWWGQICSDVVSLPDFINRSRLGKWSTRREAYWREVRDEILRESKYRAVHDRVAELHEMQSLRSDLLDAVKPRIIDGVKFYPVKPGTMEGMISAFVKLDQLADNKRDAVLTMIEPELQHEVQAGASSVFTPEELRRVSRMLLEQRRAQQLLLLAEGQDEQRDDDEDDDDGAGENRSWEPGPDGSG
jgi:hypothetical protein